ncbi:MAG TPA: hypothetical protein VGN54_11885 [Mycobacteriales bacterium]|jgi:hypothetical protein|nr:hypothetical protein [Mycobacteriales bacterium]
MTQLLAALVDDAGLFPPEQLDMATAVARHRVDAQQAYPMLTHRFVCPASRVAELSSHLGPAERIAISLIADEGWAASPPTGPGVQVMAVEGRVDPGWWPSLSLPTWCELGWSEGALSALAGAPAGVGIKLRCGGVTADLYPQPGQLAAAIVACVDTRRPFKATAGLHRALSESAGGVVHFGYLSLLLATAAAVSGAGAAAVERELLGAPDAVLRARDLTPDQVREIRAVFTSYGSCSTSEPREEALALGLLP